MDEFFPVHMPLILKCHMLASHTCRKEQQWPFAVLGLRVSQVISRSVLPFSEASCWHLRAGIPAKLLVVRNVQRFFETLTKLIMQKSVLFFWGLCWVVIGVCGLSLVVAHRLLIAEHRLCRVCGLFRCGAWVQSLWLTGCSCPIACGNLSSRTRDRTRVPCIARWILGHWTTRKVPQGSAL